MSKTHTQSLKRALERLGFVFLRGGWVRREVAPKLQAQIDKAVKDAAEDVAKIKGDSHED
jgi:hypothetical protein